MEVFCRKRNDSSNNRTNKGSSIIAFPNDYTIVDVETTGLVPEYDDIIEVGALKVAEGIVVDTFQSFIMPYDGFKVPDFINSLTGITDEMLSGSPSFSDIKDMFLSFVGNSIIIGHNVGFDINFLYDATCGELSNDYIDTMRISRRLHPEERHHRLKDLVIRYSVKSRPSHRAIDDCYATYECFKSLCKEITDLYPSLDDYVRYLIEKDNRPRSTRSLSGIMAESDDIDPDNPLYGMNIVFTGKLDGMTRAEAAQCAVNHGAVCQDNVTKTTNILVLGNNDYCSSIKDGKSSKQKKAEKLISDGYDLSIINESIFYDYINEYK